MDKKVYEITNLPQRARTIRMPGGGSLSLGPGETVKRWILPQHVETLSNSQLAVKLHEEPPPAKAKKKTTKPRSSER